MQSHSPGPWRWEVNPKSDDSFYEGPLGRILDTDGKCVCDFGDCTQYDSRSGAEPSEEDIRLMIEAPELLKALQWLVDDLEDSGEDRNQEGGEEYASVANARAVIQRIVKE